MKYDLVVVRNIHGSNLSCAFNQHHENMRREIHNRRNGLDDDWWNIQPVRATGPQESFEDRMWNRLCQILVSSERRPVLIPSTDLEPEWRDLLAACPYIELVGEAPSHHGRYMAQIWIARKHERNV